MAAPLRYAINVTESGTGTGGVTSSPGTINCPGVCGMAGNVIGTPQTLVMTATPNAGSYFVKWSGVVPIGSSQTANPYTWIFTTALGNQHIDAQFSACPIITLSPSTLPNGIVGSSYSQTLSSSGGTAPYTDSVTAGSPPDGLNLVGETISGTPTVAGTFSFTITSTDSNGCQGTRNYTIIIQRPARRKKKAVGGFVGFPYSTSCFNRNYIDTYFPNSCQAGGIIKYKNNAYAFSNIDSNGNCCFGMI